MVQQIAAGVPLVWRDLVSVCLACVYVIVLLRFHKEWGRPATIQSACLHERSFEFVSPLVRCLPA